MGAERMRRTRLEREFDGLNPAQQSNLALRVTNEMQSAEQREFVLGRLEKMQQQEVELLFEKVRALYVPPREPVRPRGRGGKGSR